MYKIIPFLLSIFTLTSSLEGHLYHNSEELTSALPCKTEAVSVKDEQLVQRIVKAYQRANKPDLGHSMWQSFFNERHKAIHNIFQSGSLSLATQVLRNPATNDLFYGMDNLCASIQPAYKNINAIIGNAYLGLDNLVRFGESIGAIPIENSKNNQPPKNWDVNVVIPQLEAFLGVTLNFPTPYPDEWGTWTPRGVLAYRAIQALYQAYLIKKLLKDVPNPKVLEIGAGIGRTAYFARLFGIKDYTIIDIPMSAAASGYFLGRTLGEDQVLLLGEQSAHSENFVKVLTPDQFLNKDQYYDLIINVDSMTEMDIIISKAYINKIVKSTPLFVSINHENNSFTVNQLLKGNPSVKESQRQNYCMRNTYFEEIFKFH